MRFSELIIHPECACLHTSGFEDSKCYKRFIKIDDFTLFGKEIAICNEYLRLRVHNELRNEYNEHPKQTSYMYKVESIIESIVQKYVPFRLGYRLSANRSSDINKCCFNIVICRRPFITAQVLLKDCILYMNENGFGNINVSIKKQIFSAIINYANNIKGSINKRKYDDLIRASRVFSLSWHYDDKACEQLVSQALLIINEEKIKSKSQVKKTAIDGTN